MFIGTLMLLVAGVFCGLHYYVYARLLRALGGLRGGSLRWVRFAGLALALSFPLVHILMRDATGPIALWLYWIAAVWLGLFLYILLLTLLLHACEALARASRFAPRLTPSRTRHAGRISAAAVLGVALATGAWGLFEARFCMATTAIEARMKNLPPALDGYSIVQISDLHVGAIIGARRLQSIVDRVNNHAPDLIVITGDLVDEDADDLAPLAPVLGRLRARHGVLAVAGNHDVMAGLDAVVDAAAAGGVRFLRNEAAVVAGGIVVYGIDDPAAKRLNGSFPTSFSSVIGAEAKALPAILLHHRPVRPSEAAGLGIDLMLSGHTHRGQMWPLTYISRIFFPYQSGSYRVGEMLLHVSRGVGTWGPPMRIASPPEIVRITLRPSVP